MSDQPREDALAALRVILTQEPEDGSFAIEVEPGDGQRLLTAGADAVEAILNAQEAWPELTLTAGHWVDLASPETAEALRVVFHNEYEADMSGDRYYGCHHVNQHQSTWDCVARRDEVLAAMRETH